MSNAEVRRRHERAYDLGAQAFRGGRKQEDCPYRSGSTDSERQSWMQGYEKAQENRKAGRI